MNIKGNKNTLYGTQMSNRSYGKSGSSKQTFAGLKVKLLNLEDNGATTSTQRGDVSDTLPNKASPRSTPARFMAVTPTPRERD